MDRNEGYASDCQAHFTSKPSVERCAENIHNSHGSVNANFTRQNFDAILSRTI